MPGSWSTPGGALVAAHPPVVDSYMRMMRDEFETDVEQVYKIRALLAGEAATWLVGLLEDALELQDFDCFMLSLQQ
uniref:Uncharacterized protein n=1 Tax=Sphaerodactylus townsendi TaxID=933632 RepID=A0ACB8F7T6_9SAUR